tara:strand:+ start:2562 stop:3122 length:561 start_codon:yes stop_codon:yes gene_type:complete
MKIKELRLIMFILGFVIFLISYLAGFLEIHNWYFFTLGVWFVFDYFNKRKSTFQIFLKDKKLFFRLYFMFVLLGAAVEFIGRFVLGWWVYPFVNTWSHELLLVLFYPFLFITFREAYLVFNRTSKKFGFLMTVIFGVVLTEVPNLFAKDWIYVFPSVVFGALALILGWIFLIWAPLFIYESLKIKR